MFKTILMLLLPVLAFLGGAAAGDYLRPRDAAAEDAAAPAGDHAAPAGGHAAPAGGHAPAEPAAPTGHASTTPAPAGHGAAGAPDATTWFKFPQQFFVPIMRGGRLDSTMVLTLSVEMPAAAAESIYAQEIPLRDTLLRQLLIHANTGGFDGNFTAEPHMRALRDDLLKAVQTSAPEVSAVLIGDIARQDAI